MVSNEQRAVVALLLIVASGCSGRLSDGEEQGALTCGNGNLQVSGRVERDTVSDHQFTGETRLGDDSLAVVSLYSNPALGGDGPSTLIAEQRLAPAPELPFDFCLDGQKAPNAEPHVQYYVSASIQQHAQSSSVGDLVDETLTIVDPPAAGVVLQVVGLEDCMSADAGGFCTTTNR